MSMKMTEGIPGTGLVPFKEFFQALDENSDTMDHLLLNPLTQVLKN